MHVVNLRDAIILSLLKDNERPAEYIETAVGNQKTIAKKSLSLLRKSGLIRKQRTKGRDFFVITDEGKKTIDRIYRKLSLTAQ